MGTHNRLLRIATPAFPQAYLEILAIDPDAPPPGRKRWFDFDDAALQAAVQQAPRLVHVVAAVDDIAAASEALQALGIDRGPGLEAQRETADGVLRWRISVRDDGQRLMYGALPTLIEWKGAHPSSAMAASGVVLQSLEASHPRPQVLEQVCAAIGLTHIAVHAGPPNLVATLGTPLGVVRLESAGT